MRWDAHKRRYVNEKGKVIPPRQIRKQVTKYVDGQVVWAEREATKLVESIIAKGTFFAKMADKIEAWHKVTGVIAYGGRAQMDEERWARLERVITREQEYLDRFHDELRLASEIPEGIASRAALYPNAAYSTYENQVLQRESDNGVTLGRRICEKDGASCEECVSAATEEFVPLDELDDIGSLQCLNNCRCEFEFSVDGTEFRTSEVFSGVVGGQEEFGGSVEVQ